MIIQRLLFWPPHRQVSVPFNNFNRLPVSPSSILKSTTVTFLLFCLWKRAPGKGKPPPPQPSPSFNLLLEMTLLLLFLLLLLLLIGRRCRFLSPILWSENIAGNGQLLNKLFVVFVSGPYQYQPQTFFRASSKNEVQNLKFPSLFCLLFIDVDDLDSPTNNSSLVWMAWNVGSPLILPFESGSGRTKNGEMEEEGGRGAQSPLLEKLPVTSLLWID